MSVEQLPLPSVVTEHIQRSTGRLALVAAGLGLSGALVGASVATFAVPVKTHIGGAEASLRLQFGNHSEINTGGNALLGLKAPFHVGPISAHGTIDNFGFGLRPDLNPAVQSEYAQLFADPRQDSENIKAALEHQALVGAGLADTLLAAGIMAAAGRRSRRRQHNPALAAVLDQRPVREHFRAQRQRLVLGIGLTTAVLAASQYAANAETLHPNTMFGGTPLAGSEIDGLLAPAINSFGPLIADKITTTDNYYSADEKQLVAAFQAQIGNLPTEPGTFNALVVSDRHCNTGMNRVIKKVAELYKTPLILDAGDDAFSGTFSFEAACLTSLMDAVKHKATVVESPGNHDSELTTTAALKAGMIVLRDGNAITVTIAGTKIRLIGAADPRSSRYGQGIEPASKAAQVKAITAVGEKLIESTCQAEAARLPIDIVMTHDKLAVNQVLNADCGVSLGIAGHSHQKVGPNRVFNSRNGKSSFQLTEGSTGGAGTASGGGLTVAGPLLADATMTVLVFDSATKRPKGYYNIVNHIDQTFSLSPYALLEPLAKPFIKPARP